MRKIILDSFIDSDTDEKFLGSIAFTKGNKGLLLEKNGHIILLSIEHINSLLKHKIPQNLVQKLKSRGFIYDNNIIEKCDMFCQIKPDFFMIDITNKCNMHCKYCLRNIDILNNSIDENKIRDICDYINEYCEKENLLDVSIQPWGGEPLLELKSILLLRKHIFPQKTNVHFTIETNGLLLCEQMIDKLYDNKIGIGISIDGFESVHNAQRTLWSGDGTHNIVEHNLLLAQKKYGDRLGTITTITKNNAGYVEEILEYFACELNLKSVKFNFVHKSMFSGCDDLCLSNEEISKTEIKILNKIIELNKRGYYISEYNIKVKLKNLLFKQYSDICHSNGCNGGRKMIVFDMEGRIYPCELTDTPDESIGSIYDEISLIDIISDATKNRDYFIDKKDKVCNNCEWYVYCKGGCTVRVINSEKRPPAIDDVECSVNSVLYPALVELILSKPDVVNRILNNNVL